jgi:hypothetical protein
LETGRVVGLTDVGRTTVFLLEMEIVCLSRCLQIVCMSRCLPLSSESHFRLETGRVVGLTDVGRTTVFLLEMNADQRIDLRLVNQ